MHQNFYVYLRNEHNRSSLYRFFSLLFFFLRFLICDSSNTTRNTEMTEIVKHRIVLFFLLSIVHSLLLVHNSQYIHRHVYVNSVYGAQSVSRAALALP